MTMSNVYGKTGCRVFKGGIQNSAPKFIHIFFEQVRILTHLETPTRINFFYFF